MTFQYSAPLTIAGQAKVAADIANTGTINITAVAVGDGNGAPITPIVTQSGCVREVWRGAPTSVSRDPNYPSQVLIQVSVPSSAGPCTVREFAVYTDDGQCIIVGNHPSNDIAAPSQGAITYLDLTIPVVVDTAATVTIQINPASLIPLSQLLRAPFIGVDAIVSAPPANPALGATVVINGAPTGAFVGLENHLAQWNGSVWLSCMPPFRTVVGCEADGLYYHLTHAGWVVWAASDANYGLVRWSDVWITAPVTKTIHGPGADFGGLPDAFAWLARRRIAPGGFVTFQIAAGRWAYNATQLAFDHQDGHLVQIIGAPLLAPFPAALDAYQIAGSSAAQRAAGAIAILSMIRTVWATEIVLANGSQFTGRSKLSAFGQIAVTSDGVNADNIVLTSTSDVSLVDVVSHGAAYRCIALASCRASLNSVAATCGGSFGITAEQGAAIEYAGPLIAVGHASHGIQASVNAVIHQVGTLAVLRSRCNGGDGAIAYRGGVIEAAQLAANGASQCHQNGGNGFSAQSGGHLVASSAAASSNGASGFLASDGGIIAAYGTTGDTNATYGYQASGAALIQRGGGTCTGALAASTPAVGTTGNNNALVA